jgi:ribA/ribD-fused uncharacterized protein
MKEICTHALVTVAGNETSNTSASRAIWLVLITAVSSAYLVSSRDTQSASTRSVLYKASMNAPDYHDLKSLLRALDCGARPRLLLFWGHTETAAQGVTKACLSQWYPAVFTLDGETFPSAEHCMMFRKAQLFGDEPAAMSCLRASTPKQVKAIGRAVRNFDEDTWNAQRSRIVVAANTAKFEQNEALRAFLISTGEQVLVEASPTDAVWGIGLSADDPRAHDPRSWPGLNLLGFALMEVRAGLAQSA